MEWESSVRRQTSSATRISAPKRLCRPGVGACPPESAQDHAIPRVEILNYLLIIIPNNKYIYFLPASSPSRARPSARSA